MKLVRLFSVFLLGIFLNTTFAADAVNAPLTDGIPKKNGKVNSFNPSSYDIELISQDGKTWTYEVSYVEGHDLSHWVLGLAENCNVESASPSYDGIQVDPSVSVANFYGIKWNSSGGTFSFTLDQAYGSTDLDVMVKAANGYGVTSGLTGPDCSNPITVDDSSDSASDDSSDSSDDSSDSSDDSSDSASDDSSDSSSDSSDDSSDSSDDSSDSSSDDSSGSSDDSSDSSSDDSSNSSDDSSDSSSDDSSDSSDDSSDSSSDDSNDSSDDSSDSSDSSSNTASCDVPTDSVTLAAGGGDNAFTIEFLGKNGNEWSYKVTQTGRDLSHWSLGIENCEGHVQSRDVETGSGGASDQLLKDTGVDWMVKWDTDGGVGSGEVFTLTLDGDYAATDIGVLVKTGGNPQTALGTITAPNCAVSAPTDCGDVVEESANDDNWADGFSGEYVAWGQMGNGSGTSYFGETLWTDDSICTLAQEGVLEKAWYEPQWIKARGRIVLFKQDGDNWVQGGELKTKLSLGWYIVYPKNSRNLTDEPIICPTEMPDGVALPVECADGPDDKYKDGHYLTSREVLTSDENGVIEFETYGWWTGVPEGYRDALNLMKVDGSPDWSGRNTYVVENHYGGTLRGGDEGNDYLLANLDFSGQQRGIGRDVAWNASWNQQGCDLPETDEPSDEADDATEPSDETNPSDETDGGTIGETGANNIALECPTGTDLLASFDWNGSRYVLDGSNEGGIILRGVTVDDIANASAGQWTSAVPVVNVMLSSEADSYTYELQGATSGDFSKSVLDNTDIASMKFCGAPDAPKEFDDLSVDGVEVLSSVRVWDLRNATLVCENATCDAGLLQNFAEHGKIIASQSEADLLLEWEVSNAKGLPLRYEYIYLDITQ
jgi:hypothetical protein